MRNEVLSPILREYLAFVFEQGVFPQILKMAKVISIFESGNGSFTCNIIAQCPYSLVYLRFYQSLGKIA